MKINISQKTYSKKECTNMNMLQKLIKKRGNIIPNLTKMRSENRSHNLMRKICLVRSAVLRRRPPGTLQFNKTPKEITYTDKIETIQKTERHTCNKSTGGATICESTKQMAKLR